MKNIIIALVVVVVLSSCQKRGCYTCSTLQFSSNTSFTPTTTKYEQCDWTEDDAKNYASRNTSTWNGGGFTMTEKTNCVLK